METPPRDASSPSEPAQAISVAVALPSRTERFADAGLRLLAALVFASMLVAAWHDVSRAWDVWFYHLPFAARMAGIVDEASYAFGRANQARFDGFPLAGEALQGLAWRVTGRPEAANLVAFAAIPALAWLLHRAFHVRPHLTVLAVVAIPLVQIHASAAYVDLPANACATMLVLLAFRQVVRREPPTVRVLAGAAALAALTANTKFQLVPVVLAASAVMLATALRKDDERRARLLVIALAMPLVMATPLKNLALHGNPVWPVELRVLGRSLPHVETAYASSPDWLEHASRPVRFAASVVEMGLRPLSSHARWSIDQWTPPSEPGYRMGGFFGAYAIANLLALAAGALVVRSRESRVAIAFVVGATALTSLLPQSHELRYYLYWMLLLVALNLVVWRERAPTAAGLVAVLALGVVAWSTEATYLYPSGSTFRELVDAHVDLRALDRVTPGSRVCVARQPWTFLYAPRFHAPRSYSVQEAEAPAECEGAPPLPEGEAASAPSE